MAKLPGIPSLSALVPREISAVLRPMREILLAFTSSDNPVARAETLIKAGLIAGVARDGSLLPAPRYDATPPPAPTHLTAAGALATVILSWDASASKNIAYAEVWRADTDDFSLAQLIGRAAGRLYPDSVGGGATRYYWIRYISAADIPGPFNAQAGTLGATAQDASYLMDVLAANPPVGANYNQLLYTQAAPIVIDGVTIPAGVYMTAAYVRALSVTNAQIANLAVDNAKIAGLDAAKITTGYVDAARINVGSLDAKIANISAAVITSGFISQARIQDATITNAKIFDLDATKINAGYLNAARIQAGTIDASKLNVGTLSAITANIGLLRTSTSGQRTEFDSTGIRVYDSAGTLRVRLGVW